MRGIMAKTRCEEIVIDHYLQSHINNEFKNDLLWLINERRNDGIFLEVLSRLLGNNNKATLKVLDTLSQVAIQQVITDCPEGFMSSLIKEYENEPSN